jgi:hypothetical protein
VVHVAIEVPQKMLSVPNHNTQNQRRPTTNEPIIEEEQQFLVESGRSPPGEKACVSIQGIVGTIYSVE